MGVVLIAGGGVLAHCWDLKENIPLFKYADSVAILIDVSNVQVTDIIYIYNVMADAENSRNNHYSSDWL